MNSAQAMPSFVRQTGMSCNQCHFTHDPVPNFTIQGMKFRSMGYRIPERATKLRAGSPGATQGETLDLPMWDYLSFRFESDLVSKSKAPGGETTETASNPTTRFAFFATGPVTDHIGFWNEFYFTGNGANNAIGGSGDGGSAWAPGLTAWDEYDLVWTVNPDAIQENGDVYSIRFTNQGISETDGFGPGPGGVPSFIGPRGGIGGYDHPPEGGFRATGWMHDRWVWQFGIRTGDNNSGWAQKMYEYSAAYFFRNASDDTIALRLMGQWGDDEIPYATSTNTQSGANQNPLVYTYRDAIPGISATRGAGLGPYLNTDLDRNVAYTPQIRWQKSDVGADGGTSWLLAAGYGYGKDTYKDSASFETSSLGASFLYCWMHTYCAQPIYTHSLKQKFTDHTGKSYNIDTPDSWTMYLIYQPAMNFAVVGSISNASTLSLTAPAKTGGYSFSVTLDFPM
ncbi:MAG TPA: hypothetical protein VEG27_14705 [Usitatibacter sp.]|nr:hypothetical protein [Usitatibacter sp.]